MIMLFQELVEKYRYLNEEMADPRAKDYFLMSQPWGIITLLAVYVYFVCSLGPRLMAERKPFRIENFVRIYDLMQIVINAYIFYMAMTVLYLSGYSLRCEPVDYGTSAKAILIYEHTHLFFLVKVLDLVDTVIFVLRKKRNQISFLHVYHHVIMVQTTWLCTKYFAGGQALFVGTINSLVHTIMYTYYLIASLKSSSPWWKKHITQLQMLQFLLIFIHFVQVTWEDCGFPNWVLYIALPQDFFVGILFVNFYYKTYIKKQKKQAQESNVRLEASNDAKKDE